MELTGLVRSEDKLKRFERGSEEMGDLFGPWAKWRLRTAVSTHTVEPSQVGAVTSAPALLCLISTVFQSTNLTWKLHFYWSTVWNFVAR